MGSSWSARAGPQADDRVWPRVERTAVAPLPSRGREVFPDEAIFSAVRREINWTHVKTLIYVEDPLKCNFYIELCRLERWSSRQLQVRIQSMLFERSAIARKPTEVIQQELSQLRDARRVTPEPVLKDPYILDFLGPNDRYL